MEIVQRAVEMIARSRYAVAFTGAGISTPSGIPDFRSPVTGLWNQHDPYEVASLSAFRRNPHAFFEWIRPLALSAESASPNAAHISLAKLEASGFIKAIITQNIDGLHSNAGSRNVFELHGSALTATCPNCGTCHSKNKFKDMLVQSTEMPRCVKCRTIIKPDIVLFGETLPAKVWNGAFSECQKSDLIIVAGSSLEVSPANYLPKVAIENGAKLIINNIGATSLNSRADLLLQMDVISGIGILGDLFA